MTPTYDATQTAAHCGVTRNWITKLAKRHNLGRIERKCWRFTENEVAQLRRIIDEAEVGNPLFKR